MVALAIVELDAVGLLGESGRCVSAHTGQNGIFLNERAFIIDETHLRLQLIDLVHGLIARKGVIGECRQIGKLIEPAVIALALIAVESQLGQIGLAVGRTTVAHIAEATAHMDVHRGEHTAGRRLVYQIKGDSIQEVRVVGALKQSQQHAGRIGRTHARGK